MATDDLTLGPPPGEAALAVVMLHGRGRLPDEMIDFARSVDLPDISWTALRAPEEQRWYPRFFMAPVADNQPWLNQALAQIDAAIAEIEAAGVARDRIALVGFSQGACLASQYVLQRPARWAALIGMTGGLLGPDGTVWDQVDVLDGLPVLLSNSEADSWIPWTRSEETAAAFRGLGGDVTLTQYPGRDHLICDEEIAAARAVLETAAGGG